MIRDCKSILKEGQQGRMVYSVECIAKVKQHEGYHVALVRVSY